jgi:hypothetical protein
MFGEVDLPKQAPMFFVPVPLMEPVGYSFLEIVHQQMMAQVPLEIRYLMAGVFIAMQTFW